jgi:predicted TIM-barrel fold metal-dependent hydrolase
MIVDTDTHAFPLEIFDQDFQPRNLVDRIHSVLENQFDIDGYWKKIYDSIKDSSWPECGTIADFAKLPKRIRYELKHKHDLGALAHISDDLQMVHVDHMDFATPSLDTQIKSAKLFCKVDRQVINCTPRPFRMLYSTETSLAVKIMQTWNSGMSRICANRNDLDFTLWLAIQDFDASIKELQDYADRDFFGVWLDERQPWAWQQDKMSLFEICNTHRIPLYFHTVGLDDAPISWVWDYSHPRYRAQYKKWPGPKFFYNGDRWQANIASLITEGILDRFPDLRIVITEHGLNWIKPMQEFMLSQGWPDPMPYFKNNFWFTVEIEEENFIANANHLGWDRLLFATDYPHNDPGGMHRYKDVDLLQDCLPLNIISQQQYDLITHQNYQLLKSRR